MSDVHLRVGNLNGGTGPKSVTQHLPGLLAGRKEAIQALWERFCGPCRILARRRLGHAGRLVDEDDVVTDAFLSFCAAARAGKFPDLTSRDNVIRLLAAFTMRKAFDARRKIIRRGDKVRTESVLGAPGFEPFENLFQKRGFVRAATDRGAGFSSHSATAPPVAPAFRGNLYFLARRKPGSSRALCRCHKIANGAL
jgi:hypothetical protein